MIEPMIKNLLEAGVHFGHQTHRWNPKMRPYIFGEKNGIYILDLEKTASGLLESQEFLHSVAAEGGHVLFVGTKRQAQAIVAEQAGRCNQYYVNLRWLGGLLTNFQTIRRSIERLKAIRTWRQDGTLQRLTKKEAAQREKELAKLEKVLSGIIEMEHLPKAIIVVDAKREETAVKEARILGIPVVALVDTNTDPDPISYVIPGNDDAIRSITVVLSHLADALLEGRQVYLAGHPEPPQPSPAVAEEAEEPADPGAAVQEGPHPEVETLAVVDEVEAIVPEGTLKVVEKTAPPKKKRVPKVKADSKPKESEGKAPVD